MQNPYTSPESHLSRSGTVTTPSVMTWFKVYAAFMAFMYLLLLLGGSLLLIFGSDLADEDNPAEMFLFQGILFVVMALPLLAVSVIGVFLPPKNWAWIYGIVLIGLGMTSCCFLPVCVPLLIFWIKPETQAYFGRLRIE